MTKVDDSVVAVPVSPASAGEAGAPEITQEMKLAGVSVFDELTEDRLPWGAERKEAVVAAIYSAMQCAEEGRRPG